MDIPEDIKSEVEKVLSAPHAWDGYDTLSRRLARAIVAERERCAKVCEAVGSDLDPQYADHIASAIRATPNQTGEVDRT